MLMRPNKAEIAAAAQGIWLCACVHHLKLIAMGETSRAIAITWIAY